LAAAKFNPAGAFAAFDEYFIFWQSPNLNRHPDLCAWFDRRGLDFAWNKNVSKWCDLVGFSAIWRELAGFFGANRAGIRGGNGGLRILILPPDDLPIPPPRATGRGACSIEWQQCMDAPNGGPPPRPGRRGEGGAAGPGPRSSFLLSYFS
jgi:hypothetical protein